LLSPWTTEGLAIALSKQNVTDLAVEHGINNVQGMNDYLIALSRSRSIQASRPAEKMTLSASIEGSLKLSQKLTFQSQFASNLQSLNLPSWYDTVRKTANKASSSSEYTSIQSVDQLHQVYGLNLYPISDDSPILPRVKGSSETLDVNEQEILQRMNTNTSQQIDAVLRGEWGCECVIDPSLQTTVSLVGKLKSLGVPPLSQNFGVAFENEETKEVAFKGMGDWRPKIEGLVASSSPVQGHSGAVPRLAVSQDQHFFVSCSFDSTCKVWELGKIANSNGVLESSNTYSGHLDSESGLPVRVNDIVILEGSHSVASASSDGRVHIWKVDLVTSSLPPAQIAAGVKVNNFSRVSGTSFIREIDRKEEGEIMALSHFNTLSESVVAFATQRGYVHSWDLRCEREPFQLSHDADMGYLTSMAFGNDRNWVVCGTNKGYVALWDIRFQRNVKLWQHSGGQAINRLSASYAPIPGAGINSSPRPLAFVTSGGECGMFDLLDGACRQCFRTDYTMSALGPGKSSTEISQLHEIDTSGGKLTSLLRRNSEHRGSESRRGIIPTMNAMVGSMGGNDQNYLITGGGDAQIRYWDFASPLKCYTICGQIGLKYRPIFEVKNSNGCRMMVCKESPEPRHHNYESSKLPRISKRGLGGIESRHQDAILDLKLIQSPIKAILSCSRDGSIKIFQ
jgi:phosphoinositide-3-kinase, regulatory subunit 4